MILGLVRGKKVKASATGLSGFMTGGSDYYIQADYQ
jgi:hypothetical protein